MTNRFAFRLILLLAVIALLATAASARVRPGDNRLQQAEQFANQRDRGGDNGISSGSHGVGLPVAAAPNVNESRGALVSQTYYDWQATSVYRGMVETNPRLTPSDIAGVHFTYMSRPGGGVAGYFNRCGYNYFDASTGTFAFPGGTIVVQNDGISSSEATQYPRITVDQEGKGVITQTYWLDIGDASSIGLMSSYDLIAGGGQFGGIFDGAVMQATTMHQGDISSDFPTQWPEPALTATSTDTILYLAAVENNCEGICASGIKVWRKIGESTPGFDPSWTLVYNDTAWWVNADMSADPTSTKVALVWTLGPPGDRLGSGGNYDVVYAESPTGASGTWTKHNVTNYSGPGYRADLEVNSLYDSEGQLHVVWNGTYGTTSWGGDSGRLFHWSQRNPSIISIIYPFEYNPAEACGYSGTNTMNVSRYQIGECDGRMYIVFVSWNDPTYFPAQDDCCKSASLGNAANGEVYVTVSKDLDGKSWDKPRNLSNSYSPNCDTGTCAADNYASISRFGIDDLDYAGTEQWTNALTYDPSGGSYTGTAYTQVMYFTDRYPGYAHRDQGPYTLNDFRWIRMACVSPVLAPNVVATPSSITYPEFGKPGVAKIYSVILDNIGNANATIGSIVATEDSVRGVGSGSGWLSVTNTPSVIPEAGRDSMRVTLNVSGVIATGPTVLFGHVTIPYTTPAASLTFPIQFTVADTIVHTVWDSVSTSCLDLIVGTDGNMGNNYQGKVNMDYAGNPAECDTGPNSRGDAESYLGDGSPIIIRKPTPTTFRGSWSAYSSGFQTPTGFKPASGSGYAPHGSFSTASYDGFNSGTFLTVDSLVKVEKTWWAPKHADSCNFIVQRMRVFPATIGTAVTNLQIGEVIDFDVPTDSGTSNNVSGTDQTRRMVWMRGFNSGDTVTDCADNSRRYAGIALLNWFMKNKACFDSLYGGSAIANDAYVYGGVIADSMSQVMHVAGYSTESRTTDVSALLTFKDGTSGYTLPANDTLTIFTALATVRTSANTTAGLDSLKKYVDKAKEFMKKNIGVCASCCQGVTGNVNMTGIVDLSDLSALVSYLTGGGYVLLCSPEANVNNTGIVDLSDLSALVSYLTGGGYVLPNCS